MRRRVGGSVGSCAEGWGESDTGSCWLIAALWSLSSELCAATKSTRRCRHNCRRTNGGENPANQTKESKRIDVRFTFSVPIWFAGRFAFFPLVVPVSSLLPNSLFHFPLFGFLPVALSSARLCMQKSRYRSLWNQTSTYSTLSVPILCSSKDFTIFYNWRTPNNKLPLNWSKRLVFPFFSLTGKWNFHLPRPKFLICVRMCFRVH